jgi:folate-binding protein YgfZ
MTSLALHPFHESRGARFGELGGHEIVLEYSSMTREYEALRQGAAVLDLSYRGRLCLTGADRARFLHGQVTNDILALRPGDTSYAALVTAKGKLVSDLNVVCLPDELLLDLEPGFTTAVRERLEKFIIADDVQVIDVTPHYGLLSVLGPKAGDVLEKAGVVPSPLPATGQARQVVDSVLGELCCANHARGAAAGFDLYFPVASGASLIERLFREAVASGGGLAGWNALELVRIEAGQPRLGQDMDETHLAPETGLETRAISYAKGCYIGQEVIARIRTYGQVAKALRGLVLPGDLDVLPPKGARLFHGEREVGFVTSAIRSPALQQTIALGYVRKEHNAVGTELTLESGPTRTPAKIVDLPFVAPG